MTDIKIRRNVTTGDICFEGRVTANDLARIPAAFHAEDLQDQSNSGADMLQMLQVIFRYIEGTTE